MLNAYISSFLDVAYACEFCLWIEMRRIAMFTHLYLQIINSEKGKGTIEMRILKFLKEIRREHRSQCRLNL